MGLPIFGTANSTAHFEPAPTTRGTWGIVQSSLVTLGLCVYTALHLNVPSSEERESRRLVNKFVKWVGIALLGPEFVVFIAWAQRRAAGNTAKALRKRAGQDEPKPFYVKWWRAFTSFFLKTWRRLSYWFDDDSFPDTTTANSNKDSQSISSWSIGNWIGAIIALLFLPLLVVVTFLVGLPAMLLYLWYKKGAGTPKEREPEIFELKHGYAVVMGALAIDRSATLDVQQRDRKVRRLTITPLGFLENFQKPEFADIDLSLLNSDDIDAKAKVNTFGKFISITQALWFCLQFFVRIHQRLPLSLLELNVFAHALCTLIIYVLWWDKPGNIEDPFVLYPEESSALTALCTEFTRQEDTTAAAENHPLGPYFGPLNQRHLRYKMANFSWTSLQAMFDTLPTANSSNMELLLKEYLLPQVFMLTASIIYSGIHLLAWDSGAFPPGAPHHLLLWKISCFLLLPTPLIMLMFKLLADQRRKKMRRNRRLAASWLLGLVLGLAITAYFVSRAYLQVEVFIALAYADRGIYEVSRISQYLPHF